MVKNISKEELKKKIDDPDDHFLLVNVLDKEEFDKEHIPGSINIPVDDPDFSDKFAEKTEDKDDEIIVYCGSFDCSASPNAAKKLEDLGYNSVYDYAGGIKDWREAGYTLISS